MAKRSEGSRKSRKFQRRKQRPQRLQKTSVLVFGEDQACRELYKIISYFYPAHENYSVRPSFGNGRSPIDVVKEAILYKDNSFDKIIVIMDSDFIEYDRLNTEQIIAEACKKIPNKRLLFKKPDKSQIKLFAIEPNCCECFLLELTKTGKVSTRKCKNCKDTCKQKKINSNDHSKYIAKIDHKHLEQMRKQSKYKWLNDLIIEIQSDPTQ
ncbi:hypothetical protein [Desulfovibrio sp. JC010]|uniref:hypothetical protein n=1 Tax=Desulfovibrio sp. JC010 TaxID=2593641 RepID=UPI0013D099E3|nr:hypothetical protein [Desulfovibrio sp. JC010]NDV26839.1 hypothetical protein [Desulfovibrio sp. JC010]